MVDSSQRVCVLLPAFREAQRIGGVVRELVREGHDVLVVDDGSPDDTSSVAREAGATVIRCDVNRGKGAALETGFKVAREKGYAAVLTMDADGQHLPAEAQRFVDAFRRGGVDVLIGNRMTDSAHMPIVRRCTNRFMSWLLGVMMKQHVPDTQCGFRLYRANALPYVVARSQGFAAESEVLLRLADQGFTIGSVPISTVYGGETSKINPVRDTVRFFRMLVAYRRERRATKENKGRTS